MIAEMVSRRYSKALFDAAASPEQLQSQLAALLPLAELFEHDVHLRRLLLAPHLSHDERQAVLDKLCEAVGCDDQVLRFLLVLTDKKRLMYLPEIAQAFKRRVVEALGLDDAHVTTAAPLDDATRAVIKQRLEKYYDKKMTMVEEVDPSLLGGGVIVVNHRMADFSVRTRLNKLRDELLGIHLP